MKSINRQILAIALPAIVSNITTPVLGLVDVAIAGHFGAAAYIGAIAVGSTMFNMIYWLFGFLRMGTAGFTSQAYGAKDENLSSSTLFRALMLSAVFSVVLILFSVPLCDLSLWLIDADSTVAQIARAYFLIGIFGAPAVLGIYVLNGWYLGMQNTSIPMYVSLLTNIVNILTSLVLVIFFDMYIEGLAIGTITAQWVGFITALVILLKRYNLHRILWRELIDSQVLRRMFNVNLDIFLRTLCMVAVTVWFTRAGTEQGVEILAANALLLQFFMFFSYFSDGFAFAGEALSGKYYGAGDKEGFRRTVILLLKWGAAIAFVFTAVYLTCGKLIISLLTDDKLVRIVAGEYLVWAAVVPACGILAFIYDGIYIGLTRTRIMLVSLFVASVIYFVIYFAFKIYMGNHALWLAFCIYLLIRGIYLHFSLSFARKSA